MRLLREQAPLDQDYVKAVLARHGRTKMERMEFRSEENHFASQARALLRLLRDRTSLTPQEIRAGIGISKQGAMDLLNPMLEAGLIQRVGTRKSGRYILSMK